MQIAAIRTDEASFTMRRKRHDALLAWDEKAPDAATGDRWW